MDIKKLLPRIFLGILILLSGVGCSGSPATSQPGEQAQPSATEVIVLSTETPIPPTATTVPPTDTPTPQPNKLDLFDSTVVDIMTILDGPRVTVARAGQSAMRSDPNKVIFPLEPYIGTGKETIVFTLKYDPAQDQYLLSIDTGSYWPMQDFPLTYTEGEGFSGQGTVKSKDKEFDTTVTIKPGENGYEWSIAMVDTEGVYSVTFEFESTPE
jgi:hypothetical protein